MLYIVATPIGNLKDITLRAIETLKSVDLIACEDTRHTQNITTQYQISKPLTSYFEHNKVTKGRQILELLKQGKSVALVSDAGTPGISDPGFHLIRLAIENNIPLTIIPGPTAIIAALVLSGFPTHKFVFEGFLPVKKEGRRKLLKKLAAEERTIVAYESPHRLLKTLEDMVEVLDDPLIACIREVTKKFEEIRRERASALLEHFTKQKPRGEFVLVLNPAFKH
ncbi:MAG: 16S rRNA (cytidine(1402)-2'-O)-methyltransferase [Candidatus Omnitrophota bacterium]|nr:16S rRNA (cytidine(1402)-2'-O)-methyltransferase [Candidatus Omnitrophota bacterium]